MACATLLHNYSISGSLLDHAIDVVVITLSSISKTVPGTKNINFADIQTESDSDSVSDNLIYNPHHHPIHA